MKIKLMPSPKSIIDPESSIIREIVEEKWGQPWTKEIEKWWKEDEWTVSQVRQNPKLSLLWSKWREPERALFKYWRTLFSTNFAIFATKNRLWPPHVLTPTATHRTIIAEVVEKRIASLKIMLRYENSKSAAVAALDKTLTEIISVFQGRGWDIDDYCIFYEVHQ